MKNKKTIVGVIFVVLIVLIIGGKALSQNLENQKIEKLKQEYTALLDEKMTNVYEDKDCIEYKLTDISYSVINLEKTAKGYYTVSVVVDCTSNDPELWSATESLLAYAVEDYVPGNDYKEINASTGDRITLENKNYKDSYYGEKMLTVNVNGKHVHGPEAHDYSSSSSSSKDTVTCKSCNRKFQKGSENAKSISRTNMCTNCYNNYKGMSDWLKEQPVN